MRVAPESGFVVVVVAILLLLLLFYKLRMELRAFCVLGKHSAD